MRPRLHPLRVGLFALVALALIGAALVVAGGGRLFAQREPAELLFNGSVMGLQTGAPVVFRGVRVGNVTAVAVRDDGSSFSVPVRIEIDRSRFAAGDAEPPPLQALVQRGLQARLATQSLLTGLQIVALDIGAPLSTPPERSPAGLVRIPTQAVQPGLQAQLQQIDLKKLGADLTAAAVAARELLADPELRRAVAQMAALSESLARTGALLEQRLPPLAERTQATLAQAGEAARALAAAAQQLGAAADQVAATAAGAQGLLAPDSPLVGSVRRAADQLAGSAAALRTLAADDGTLVQSLDGTLAEMKRASRSVRELAELLERHPDALLRGRPEEGR